MIAIKSPGIQINVHLFAAAMAVMIAIGTQTAQAGIRYDTTPAQIMQNYDSLLVPAIYDKLFHSRSFEHFRKFYFLQKKLNAEQQSYDSDSFQIKAVLKQIMKDGKRVDTGENFLREVVRYNNRLDYYDLYIKLAKECGYVVTSYSDYLEKYMSTDQKVLILRHDIDVADEAAKYMLDIEKRNKVKASYYFRWRTFDQRLIRLIAAQGSEVGLHYETIADYCMKNCKSKLDGYDIKKCRELLKLEIKRFKSLSGVGIKTIASHGNQINRSLGIPNYILLFGQSYKDYGISGETYDRGVLQSHVKSYISDADIDRNFGFSYQSDPTTSILEGDKVIELLTHPNHWSYDSYKRAKFCMELKLDMEQP